MKPECRPLPNCGLHPSPPSPLLNLHRPLESRFNHCTELHIVQRANSRGWVFWGVNWTFQTLCTNNFEMFSYTGAHRSMQTYYIIGGKLHSLHILKWLTGSSTFSSACFIYLLQNWCPPKCQKAKLLKGNTKIGHCCLFVDFDHYHLNWMHKIEKIQKVPTHICFVYK